MSVERIKQSVERILTRVATAKGLGEEATKQALVLPMLEALGWDIWNPQIVQPEFESDTAIKKSGQKEKVDYAILQRGVPRIFIEVKAIDVVLDGHHGQLKRYFNSTPSVTLAILTNKADEIAHAVGSWRLHERVLTMEFARRERVADWLGAAEAWVLDRDDVRLIVGCVGGNPRFRDIGLRILRSATITEG